MKQLIYDSDGTDELVIYVRDEKAVRRKGPSYTVRADEVLTGRLKDAFGPENVKVTAGRRNHDRKGQNYRSSYQRR